MKENPTYDKNKNPVYIKRESLINQDKKWISKTNKEFHSKYGHWYYFAGMKCNSKKGWIERYRKEPNKGN